MSSMFDDLGADLADVVAEAPKAEPVKKPAAVPAPKISDRAPDAAPETATGVESEKKEVDAEVLDRDPYLHDRRRPRGKVGRPSNDERSTPVTVYLRESTMQRLHDLALKAGTKARRPIRTTSYICDILDQHCSTGSYRK